MALFKKSFACLSAGFLLPVTQMVWAADPGALDPSFSGDGIALTGFNPLDSSALAVLQQADGKIVTAGYSSAIASENKKLVLARYNNSNGSLDTSFNSDGVLEVSMGDGMRATAIAQQSDGRLVTAGWVRQVGSNDKLAVVRVKANGTLDTSFSGDGIALADAGNANARAYAVAARDGAVLAAGCTNQGGTTGNDFMLANFKSSDGLLNSNFGSGGGVLTDIGGGTDCAYGIIKQKDGNVVLLGEASIVRNEIPSRDFGVVRYQSNGNVDKSFSSDGKTNTEFRTNDDAVARAGIQQKDGKLVIVGSSAPISGGDRDFALVRYLADGSLDSNFGSGGKVLTDIAGDNDVATGVIQQWDGKLLVAGNSGIDGVLVRYNSNGTLDTGFGVNGKLITSLAGGLTINGMTLQADGQVVTAGYSYASGNYVMAVLRYLFDDDDSDGVVDTADNCQFVSNPGQENHDDDAMGDACDDDDDNDGVPDVNDAFPFDPTESVDTDGDGIGNNADPDDDNDGVLDGDDPFPLDPFLLARVIGNKADLAGYSVAMVGDVNGDGYADILVGAPKADVVLPSSSKKSADVGIAILLSGQDFITPLHTFSGAAKGDEFGSAVAALGDVNGDGIPDFAIGAPKADEIDAITKKILTKDRGSVTVYSGADFSEIFSPLNGEAKGDSFGVSIAAAGADILVGAWKADGVDASTLKLLKDAGAAYLYDGATGAFKEKFPGAAKGDYFGYSVAVRSDLDHDGVPDIAIGAYRHDPIDSSTNKPKKDAGSVYVYSGAEPYTLLKQFDGEKKGDYFGFALASANEGQDAFRDLLVGSPRADVKAGNKKLTDAGSVALFADTSGSALYNATAEVPQVGALFGLSVAVAGDVDASGSESFVVGAPKMDITVAGKKLKDAGQVLVRSAAASGDTVFAVDGKIAGAQAGYSVAGGEDFNNDTYSDVLIGSPFARFNNLSKAGIAEVISGKEAAAAY